MIIDTESLLYSIAHIKCALADSESSQFEIKALAKDFERFTASFRLQYKILYIQMSKLHLAN
jgi:hypothetical protein